MLANCHIPLGQPWQFNVDATYKGHDKVYSFWRHGRKRVLVPIRDKTPKPMYAKEKNTFLTVNEDQFMEDAKEAGEVWKLVVKEDKLLKYLTYLHKRSTS